MHPLDGQHLAVVDVEGNGQQPPDIIEIAVIHLDGQTIGQARTSLIRPPRPITPIVTAKVHGIGDRDVADAPTWKDVEPDVLQALAGRILVAHNATVETAVLTRHIAGWRPDRVIDTLRLARRLWPDLPRHGLDDLAAARGLQPPAESGTRHRAGYDAHLTALLLLDLATDCNSTRNLIELGSTTHRPVAPQPDTLW